ncbi:diacylglycerol O-acyltransferase [Mycobacterium sp. 852013-50091_SCH5140682]|uniref:wax ester/triacylglycerol synthase domain-containing protein n=1 Tax=Mycobacterium sp. 852013-50091_SCH5140682 TaxID=1834109 RepID=UPI0007EAD645|nr:wax ester/triacylglycerol synthase domain-containing protein [Mycobacterium sp. 852013-50091_SCH5140682]OBC00401.1 diacylglycerol O-acyltransferase [Mycobacterium sp. 852013-50091_SCH5140682]
MCEYLSGADAFMWSLGKDPVLRSTIVTLIELERAPDWQLVADRFDQISRAVPRFRQRVVRSIPLLPPRWELDPDFDIGFHLHRSAGSGLRQSDLLALAAAALMAGYDHRRPLWEATFVDGLPDGGGALLCKFDHALTDGIGAVQIATILYDNLGMPPEGGRRPSRSLGLAPRAMTALRHPVDAALAAIPTALSIYRAVRPIAGPRSPIMRDRTPTRHLDILEVSKPALQCAGRAAGGSLNDAFIAAVAGGLRRYHECHDVAVDELVLSMPISIRRQDDVAGGNRATLMRLAVPVGITDPARRICEVHERTSKARAERSLAYTQLIASGLNAMPRRYVRSELRRVDFVASDVPGFPLPLRLGGAPVRMQYAFSPTLGASINTTMLTYVDTCAIGINVDTGAIPDPDVLHGCLAAGFDETISIVA